MDTENIPQSIRQAEQYGARNYEPLPVAISQAEGVWVTDSSGKRYMDMLSAYSALNQGHRHPRIIAALKEQADKVTLTSRAFHNEVSGPFYEKLSKYTGNSNILAMNTGAEAVETAIKAARRWAYRHKGVPENKAEIIVCEGNFHGRTITATSLSSTDLYKYRFGPFTPGFRSVPYGDIEALRGAITPYTAALLIEPIQGEAGIVMPPDGYLAAAAKLCKDNGVLLAADEIQTGFGRTGKKFAVEWEGVDPDIFILGKALGGGVVPISAIAADREIMGVFEPGSHGSTFGGNPLACAVASAALDVLEDERLAERSLELGFELMERLSRLKSTHIVEIRGRGLFVGIVLDAPARPFCEKLMNEGLLCKETHEHIIRLAPPLVITRSELDYAVERLSRVLHGS
ncbi:ornithine--oxo-acid transaminase [Paenibacillus sp. HB172176]|uniref:ornithine--oxo-acid transaminase n=1 Tax=Paenibacillus sp. HB172176 TaxID=2493690 RepID=UPI0014393491|nr:ornithine--oxo-acid transaminase [Paenibacillus sp. HB172176]